MSYSLWKQLNDKVAYYLPAVERDSFCNENNLLEDKPETLLEKSLNLFQKKTATGGVKVQQPVIQKWSMILPSSPGYTHFLTTAKLTGFKMASPPFRAFDNATHEYMCIYQKNKQSNSRLLFRVQITVHRDEIATSLGCYILKNMVKIDERNNYRLLRTKLDSYKDLFWINLINLKLIGE